ncbi:MAG: hypothetical protein LBQ93_01355 [Treponema sp.]|jgi:hypothetical protein|nr:hypothetical protein [Treponema sp.]
MKKMSVFILFLVGSTLFADPITITENGDTIVLELVSEERSKRLKELYESRYTYVFIIDSIEFGALSRGNDTNETELNEELDSFREQIFNIPNDEYKVAAISMSNGSILVLGLMYFGHDYFFIVLFTNSYDTNFINLRYDRQRYETIFRNTWNMLF